MNLFYSELFSNKHNGNKLLTIGLKVKCNKKVNSITKYKNDLRARDWSYLKKIK